MPIRSFSRLALVFVALFVTLMTGNLFPLQPGDPSWQTRVIGTLVNSATLPLLALGLLHLAVLLDPKDPRVQQRYQLFCRLAAVASLGFLLLVPPYRSRPACGCSKPAVPNRPSASIRPNASSINSARPSARPPAVPI